MHLKILPLTNEARGLYQNHPKPLPGDAGFDLFMPEEVTIEAGETKFVDLHVKLSAHRHAQDLAKSISFFVMPRSSISKTPLRLANSVGLIDAGYRGNIIAILDNIKTHPYTIQKGQRLLQVVGFDGETSSFEIVNSLDATVRGAGGLGSTGC